MLRLLELSIIYLHSEAFSTKTTVSEVKYSGLVGLLEHVRRLWQLNHIPAVCMYVVPFVRFLFNENNSTYHLSLENHVDYVSLRDMEIQIVLDSFFNPKTKKIGSKFSYFWVTYVPYTFTLPVYFDLPFTPRFVIIVLLLICARPFPFSLFRVTKTLTFKTTQSAKPFLWNSFSFALEQKIIFISITLHL